MNKQEFDQVRKLTAFLERFIPEVKKKNAEEIFEFSEEDKVLWDTYFKELILTNVLADGTAFGAKSNNSNLGIGTDGSCYPAEFYQLLMQCYKYMYLALSAGEIYLKYNGWYLAEKDGNEENASPGNN